MAPVRTLVADDNWRFRDALTRFLATWENVEIVGQVESGRAAVAAVGTLQPQLVLMDLRMPGMNGFEATREIKREPSAPRVVIVTLDDTHEHRERAQSAGADGIIGKGSLLTTLAPLVRRLFH